MIQTLLFVGNFATIVVHDLVTRRVNCFQPSIVGLPVRQPVHLRFVQCDSVSTQCFDPPCCYNKPLWHWLNSRWHVHFNWPCSSLKALVILALTSVFHIPFLGPVLMGASIWDIFCLNLTSTLIFYLISSVFQIL